MKSLLKKELRLALHPTNFIFLVFSAMLLIPTYPYYVAFFYTTLGIFFMCLTGRENHDVDFTLQMPICRRDLVRARITTAVIFELAQLLLAIPFAVLSRQLNRFGNLLGMDANVALFGSVLVMLGLFNLTFFPLYYRDPSRVGVPFILGSLAEAAYMVLAELSTHDVPFVQRYLDTPDPAYMGAKLCVLAAGVLLFVGITILASHLSERYFEKIDL